MLEVSVHGRERGRVGGSIESGLSDVRLSDEGIASLPTKDDSKGEGQRKSRSLLGYGGRGITKAPRRAKLGRKNDDSGKREERV